MGNQKINISFLGGATSIGASSILIEIGEKNFLIDCGVRFEKDRPLPDLSMLEGKKLEAILVTHAHTDHTGGLPVISEGFPETPLYMTPPTYDLVTMLQKDALKIMDIHLQEEGDIPIYSEKQVNNMLSRVRPVHFYGTLSFDDIIVTYLPASHILGAAMIHFKTPYGNLLVTGDYFIGPQKTVPSVDKVKLPVDLVITESTYGNRFHSDRKVAEKKIIESIRQTLSNEGKVLIPAFAIGRAQEVLLILKEAIQNKKLPEIPVYVDGMVRGACSIYGRYERYVTRAVARDSRRGSPFYTKTIKPIGLGKDREKILSEGPCVIVSSSGMLSGGASSFYAEKLVGQEKNAILITGYQDEESPGRALLNLAKKNGPKTLNLNGKTLEVKCSFGSYSLSAHADRTQMVSFLDSMRPKTVILVHGDEEAKSGLKQAMGKGDIVLAEDGESLHRIYKRTTNLKKEKSFQTEITKAQIKKLTEGEGPYSLKDLAQKFWKEDLTEEKIIHFSYTLEQSGLLKRDDINSELFHKQDQREDLSLSLENEGLIITELKKENPRKALQEFCDEREIDLKRVYFQDKGVAKVHYELMVIDRKIRTKEFIHRSHKIATQLAAREAISLIQQEDPEKLGITDLCQFSHVDDSEEETFKLQNYKGEVFNFCQRLKLPKPYFKKGLHGANHIGKYEFKHNDQNYVTKWYESHKKKMIEQACAKELFSFLKDHYVEEEKRKQLNYSSDEDPRVILNNQVMAGLIKAFHYSDLKMTGPSHQPTFGVSAYAINEKGQKIEGSYIKGISKKTVQKEAAISLLETMRCL